MVSPEDNTELSDSEKSVRKKCRLKIKRGGPVRSMVNGGKSEACFRHIIEKLHTHPCLSGTLASCSWDLPEAKRRTTLKQWIINKKLDRLASTEAGITH